MSKATPGPWRAGHLIDETSVCNCTYILGNDDRMGAVATVHIDNGSGEYPPLDEAKANMCLIAAAPEMFAALKAIADLDLLEDVEFVADGLITKQFTIKDIDAFRDAADLLRDAIAKAESK